MKKLITLLLIIIVGCNTQKDKVEVADTFRLIDSTKIAATNENALLDTTHMLLERLKIIMRARDLDDSANQIYLEYAQGQNTYSNYLKARKKYIFEYDSVYVPMCDKLGLKPEGGKK
jgi:hypothetical protein